LIQSDRLSLYEPAGICLAVAHVKEADSVEYDIQGVLFAFEDLRGKGLVANFTKVKLDGFMFGLAAATFDDLAVEELATAGPGYIIDGFEAPVI